MWSQNLAPWTLPKNDEQYSIQSHQYIDYDAFNIPFDWKNEIPLEVSAMDVTPLMEFYPNDSLLDIMPSFTNPHVIEENNTIYGGYGNGFEGLYDLELEKVSPPLALCHDVPDYPREDFMVNKNNNELLSYQEKGNDNNNTSKVLSKELISQYFYMPITRAAKELNIGLTLLKKRCRELGIQRWPHRKLMSLQILIKNVQEMGKEGRDKNETKLREAIQLLEQEKKLMEDMPDLQIETRTKRLRQACFKANYKKRKLINSLNYDTSPQCSSSASTSIDNTNFGISNNDDDYEDDVMDVINFPYFCS